MLEIVAGLIAVFSAIILVAHAIEAYRAQWLGMSLCCLTYAHLTCLNSDWSAILGRRKLSFQGSSVNVLAGNGRFALSNRDGDWRRGRHRRPFGHGHHLVLLLTRWRITRFVSSAKKARDRLQPRAGLRGDKALAAIRPQHSNMEYE
jgi:hypothetical protein